MEPLLTQHKCDKKDDREVFSQVQVNITATVAQDNSFQHKLLPLTNVNIARLPGVQNHKSVETLLYSIGKSHHTDILTS